MTRDEIVDLLLARAKQKGNTELANDLITEMVAVQAVMEGNPQKFWFSLSEWATANTSTNEARLAVPANMLQEYDEGTLEVYDDTGDEPDWYPVDKDTLDVLEAKYQADEGDATARPLQYGLSGGYFILFPTPRRTWQMRMRFYKKGDSLAGTYGDSADIENVWLKYASDWMIAEVGQRMAKYYLHDDKLADIFSVDVGLAKQRLEFEQVAREEANRTRQMGDD